MGDEHLTLSPWRGDQDEPAAGAEPREPKRTARVERATALSSLRSCSPVFLLLLVALCIPLTSCAGVSTPAAQSEPSSTPRPPKNPPPDPTATPAATVERVQPLVNDTNAEDIRIVNCETDTDLHETLAAHVVVEVETAIAEQAVAVRTGDATALSHGLRTDLARLVAEAYQDAYTEAIRKLMQVDLTVLKDEVLTVGLRQKQTTYSGSVTFGLSGRAHTAEYHHVLTVPYVEDLDADECDT
jgi:hypothetical protein